MVPFRADDGPVHPGQFVKLHVIPDGTTVTKAATLLGIGRPALSNFLNGKAALSQKMARRLERAFGADREYLLNLQAQYDRREEAMRTSIVAGRHAPILIEIKAHRIEAWANTIRGREDLPPLLRHLVYTTVEKATRIDFPAGDNAQRRGWDGEIETTTPTPWIPDGRSVWEFGYEKRPGRKTNEDYDKRVKAVPRRERMDATFVFVTPRNWPRKEVGRLKWQRSRIGKTYALTMQKIWRNGSNSPRRRKSGSGNGWATMSVAFARPTGAGPIGPISANRLFHPPCSRSPRVLPEPSGGGWTHRLRAPSSWQATLRERLLHSRVISSTAPTRIRIDRGLPRSCSTRLKPCGGFVQPAPPRA